MAYISKPKVGRDYFTKNIFKQYDGKLTSPADVQDIARATAAGTSGGGVGNFYEIEPAEVLDIILDRFHPEFKSWKDIGKIKARLLYSEKNRNFDSLNWIKPLSNGFLKYPLLHEIVLTIAAPIDLATDDPEVSDLYYIMSPINVFNQLTENALPNVSVSAVVEKSNIEQDNKNHINNFKDAETGVNNEKTIDEDIQEDNELNNPNGEYLGNTFNENYAIHSLVPFEGDTIIEGRNGQSIRMGSTVKFGDTSPKISAGGQFPNWWSETGETGDPILIIRNGQSVMSYEKDIDESVVEDFDTDPTSIYLTNGQTIHFQPACKNMVTWQNTHPWTKHSGEAKRPYTFKGNQILMNADRFVFNAKNGEFMVYANGDIGFSTNRDFHINCRAFKVNATETHSMSAQPEGQAETKKAEPAVLGRQLTEFINEFSDAIIQLRFPGAAGFVDPSTSKKLKRVIKINLDKILSKQTFIKAEKGMEINS